jgi:hypothetical protein
MSGASPTTRDAPFAMPTLEIHFQLAAFEGYDLFAVCGDPAFLVAVNETGKTSVLKGVFARPWVSFGSEQATIKVFPVRRANGSVVLYELNRKELAFGFLNEIAEFGLFVHGCLFFCCGDKILRKGWVVNVFYETISMA